MTCSKTHTIDMTAEFERGLNTWKQFPKGLTASNEEIAELITAADHARNARPWLWFQFRDQLIESAGYTEKEASKEMRRARVTARLGEFPYSAEELIPNYLYAHGYRMNLDNSFVDAESNIVGRAQLENKLHIFTAENYLHQQTFRQALSIYVEDEQKRISGTCFESLRYDPQIDPAKSELRRFIEMVIAPDHTAEATQVRYMVAEAVLCGVIHRTKNHMAAFAGIKHPSGSRRWENHLHIMVVLYGTQKDGKTLAWTTILKPLEPFHAYQLTGFDFMEHTEKAAVLSYMPIMFFDEMAGISKADLESLKGVMTANMKQFRHLYAAPSQLPVVSTFVGSSNSDLSTILRDHTGNRRFIQFDSRIVRADDLKTIDARKIWKSVDEDAPNPLEANADIIKAIENIQLMQRHLSPPESWVMDNGGSFATGWHRASALWCDFKEYLESKFPGDKAKWTVRSFGTELERLSKSREPIISMRIKGNQREFAMLFRAPVTGRNVQTGSAANLNSEFASHQRYSG